MDRNVWKLSLIICFVIGTSRQYEMMNLGRLPKRLNVNSPLEDLQEYGATFQYLDKPKLFEDHYGK